MSDVQYSHEVNLRPAKAARDIYKYTKVYSNLNTGNVSLSSNSNPELTFEIPVKAMNLSKSFVSFRLDALASSAVLNSFNVKGASMIQRITLQTRSGLVLADLSYADVFSGSVPLATTDSNDIPRSGTMNEDVSLATLDYPTANILPLMKAYSIPPDVALFDKDTPATEQFVANANSGVKSFYNVSEGPAIHLRNTTAANVAKRMLMHIPLSTFVHTMLAVDKTMLLPEVLTLRVVFNDWNRFSVNEGTPDTPIVAAWTSMDVYECILNLAISKDPIVVSQLSQGLQSGIEMTIPYVHSNLQGLATASQSINLRYNISYGQRLLNVYNVVMPGAYSAIRYWSSSNVGNAMVTDYYTTLDTVRLQDSNLRSIYGEDFNEHRDLLRGSILESHFNYKANRITIDSFRAGKCIEWPMSDTIDDGIPLTSNELTYSIFNTVPTTIGAGDRVTYTFAVVQKKLSISNQAISFM